MGKISFPISFMWPYTVQQKNLQRCQDKTARAKLFYFKEEVRSSLGPWHQQHFVSTTDWLSLMYGSLEP